MQAAYARARLLFAGIGVAGAVGLVLLALVAWGEIKLGLGAICGSVGAGRVVRAVCDALDVEELRVAGATVLAPTDAAERADVLTEVCVSAPGADGSPGASAPLQKLKLQPKDERKAEERYGVDLSGDGQIGRPPEGAAKRYTAPLAGPAVEPVPSAPDSGQALYDLLVEVEVPFRRAHRTAAALRNRTTGAVEVRSVIDGNFDWLNEWRHRIAIDLDDANGFRPMATGMAESAYTPFRYRALYPFVSVYVQRQKVGFETVDDWGLRVGVELTCRGLLRCSPR